MSESGAPREPSRSIARRDASVAALRAAALEARWALVEDEPRSHEAGSSLAWLTPGGGRATWIEEHVLGVRYVEVEVGPNEAAAVRGVIERAVPLVERVELVELARGDRLPESLDALRALAVLESRGASRELIELLRRWMAHPDAGVRRAIWHLCCIGFAELKPDIQRLAREDQELGALWARLRDALA